MRIESPPQVPYFINSYEGNSVSGLPGADDVRPGAAAYNEGLYRCVTVDVGPRARCATPRNPRPTSTAPPRRWKPWPMPCAGPGTSRATRVTASWGHASGINIAGHDPRNGNDEYVTMVLASIISGAGANKVMDGWPPAARCAVSAR
jgi:N-methylhydantoinase B